MKLTPLHAIFYAYELSRRYSSNSLQKFTASLSDAQVELKPHQVEAALFAFKSPLSKGAILADEVGLGKTIEAGIVISQKWAERNRKILIICPANLRKQWNQELSDKFFLPSIILETKSFNDEIKKSNLNPFIQKDKIVICSYQFARTKEAYVKLSSWDLVVIDEAHRLRNVYKTSNKIGRALKDALNERHKILLTATPLQNSLLELYGLVSLIDDYAFGDLKSFKTQYSKLTSENNYTELKSRLAPLCKRTLRKDVNEYINYTKRTCITERYTPYEKEQELYRVVSEYLQRPVLYALPASQRQLMILILRKLLSSSSFAITGTLEGLAKKLEDLILKQTTPEINFEETLSANFETYDEIKDEWLDDEEEGNEKEERIYTPEELEEIRKEITDLKEFKALAASIAENSKGKSLMVALGKGFEKLEELGANRKAIIFTESTRTQDYVKGILEQNGYKGQIVLFNGSNNDPFSKTIYKSWLAKHKGTDKVSGSPTADKRAAIVEYFRDEATVMIATEAAAEGINLQFCSLVVNYDLPWNPQRIEQRIGRCHRYGQKFDVVVVNFLNLGNAADQRVYQLLDEKFKLFDGVFGASDEVLGSIESGIDFEKRIVEIYQKCRTTDEIQKAFDELQQDMESGIREQMEVTRRSLLENFDEEVHEKLRLNYKESQEYLTKFENRLWELTRFYLEPYAQFEPGNHSFTLKKNPFAGEHINLGLYKLGKNIENANIYRIGHPLSQKIIEHFKGLDIPIVEVIFDLSHGVKISSLENFKGKKGWLQLHYMEVSSFETEDHLLFAASTLQGEFLDQEQCQRLFSLPAATQKTNDKPAKDLLNRFQEQLSLLEADKVEENKNRNSNFFNDEVDKLEKWAEDMRNSIKLEIRELDKEIKARKTEARKLLNLEQKIKEQRAIKELERKLAEKRMKQYENEDIIENKKDSMLDDYEKRLNQHISRKTLFTIKWSII